MREIHPLGVFCPPNAKHLLLGSFPGKKKVIDPTNDWFYGTQRNQFWPILERVYNVQLETKSAKQELCTRLSLAVTDVISECERRDNTSSDMNLINCVYNTSLVGEVLEKNPIQKIFFSSRFVEQIFKKHFKDLIKNHPILEYITLPSPSPRYAALSKEEKITIYKRVLPKLS